MTDFCPSCFIFAFGIIASPRRRKIEIAMINLIGSVGGISFVSADEVNPAFHTLLQRRKRQQMEQAHVCSFCVNKTELRIDGRGGFLVCFRGRREIAWSRELGAACSAFVTYGGRESDIRWSDVRL